MNALIICHKKCKRFITPLNNRYRRNIFSSYLIDIEEIFFLHQVPLYDLCLHISFTHLEIAKSIIYMDKTVIVYTCLHIWKTMCKRHFLYKIWRILSSFTHKTFFAQYTILTYYIFIAIYFYILYHMVVKKSFMCKR